MKNKRVFSVIMVPHEYYFPLLHCLQLQKAINLFFIISFTIYYKTTKFKTHCNFIAEPLLTSLFRRNQFKLNTNHYAI